MSTRLAKKVLLVGWDAADWKIIRPLMAAGEMPALERLVRAGSSGNLLTLDPPLSPMLWTSIATGKTADQHGILGFVQPDESGTSVRPVLGSSRKVKAIWNILSQQGLRSNVVSWWPSHPAEPIQGATVSDFYKHRPPQPDRPTPLPEGTVHPPEFAEILSALRIHPAELTGAHIAPFVPRFEEVDQETDFHLIRVARAVSEASTVQAATTWLMENSEWDLTAVYFDAIDHICHSFIRYYPPKLDKVDQESFELYQDVVKQAYRFHDQMLARQVELAGDDATVVLLSDHGFHSDHLRPEAIIDEPAAPAHEHRDHGILVLSGPGVKQGHEIIGARLLDIAPTLLTLFGLPVGADMPGRVLAEVLDGLGPLETIPSWEDVPGDDGRHPAELRRDPWAEQEAMRQLADLGYIEIGDGAENVLKKIQESQFYLARVFLNTDRPAQAQPILETLWRDRPEEIRYGQALARSYAVQDLTADARRVTEQIFELLGGGLDSGTLTGDVPGLHMMQGNLLMHEGEDAEALKHFHLAEELAPRSAHLQRRIGDSYIRLKQWPEAERAFRRSTELDPDFATAYRGLSIAMLRQDRVEEALDAALQAVTLSYEQPMAHFFLGEALMRLGEWEASAAAFEVCVAQSPGVRKAHFWLAELYRLYLDEPTKAAAHLRFATEQIVSDGAT